MEFSSLLGEMIRFDLYFSDGLKPSTKARTCMNHQWATLAGCSQKDVGDLSCWGYLRSKTKCRGHLGSSILLILTGLHLDALQTHVFSLMASLVGFGPNARSFVRSTKGVNEQQGPQKIESSEVRNSEIFQQIFQSWKKVSSRSHDSGSNVSMRLERDYIISPSLCNALWNMRSYITCLTWCMTHDTWHPFNSYSNYLKTWVVLAPRFHPFKAVVLPRNWWKPLDFKLFRQPGRLRKRRIRQRNSTLEDWSLMRYLLPRKLTWNLKMNPSKRRFLWKTIILRFHVSFRGCISWVNPSHPRFQSQMNQTWNWIIMVVTVTG